MLYEPDRSSSQEASSLVNDSAGRTTRAVSRNISAQAGATATLTERSRLGSFSTGSIAILRSAVTQKGARRIVKFLALWCDMDQTKHAKNPRNTIKMYSVKNQARNPRESRTTRPPCEPHTAQSIETTLPPSRRSTMLCPTESSSPICVAAPRSLAPAAPGHQPLVVRPGC